MVEATPQVLPPVDPELAILVADELVAHGVHVITGAAVASIEADSVTLADGRVLPAELVVGAIGVRPDVQIAEAAGLELGPRGGIAVGETNQTSDPDIYAVGDVVEKPDAISRSTSLIALANIANRQGRRVADHIAGRPSHPVSSLGTAIVKVFDLVAATVGWSERRLRAAEPALPRDPLAPVQPRDVLPGRDAHGREADLRSRRRHDPRRADRRARGCRHPHRRDRDGDDRRHHRRPARRPRARVRAAVLVGQGPGEPARLHGRERAARRLRRGRRARPARARGRGMDAPRRAHRGGARRPARSPDRSTSRSTRCARSSTPWATPPSSSTARSDSAATRQPRSCTSWASGHATSTAATAPGSPSHAWGEPAPSADPALRDLRLCRPFALIPLLIGVYHLIRARYRPT